MHSVRERIHRADRIALQLLYVSSGWRWVADEELLQPICRDRRGEIPPGKAPFYEAPVFCLRDGRLTTTFVRRFIDSAPRFPDVTPRAR